MNNDVIIRKQQISIKAENEKIAFDCQRFINETVEDGLKKTYGNIFYQEVSEDQFVTINSLKIDLGVISTAEFKNHFFELVERKLVAELAKQFEDSQVTPNKKSNNDTDSSFDSDDLPAVIKYTSVKQQNYTALIYFLESGSFPWWFKKNLRKTPAELLSLLDVGEQKNLILKVLSLARVNRFSAQTNQFIQRLLSHSDESSTANFIHHLQELLSDESTRKNITTLINHKTEIANLFGISEKKYLQRSLNFILLNSTEESFLQAFFKELRQISSLSTDELKEKAQSLQTGDFLYSEVIYDGVDIQTEDSKTQDKSVDDKKTKKSINYSASEQEGIYIENAGLILLHPFLPAYFRGLNLTDDTNLFISAEAKIRASVLLYFLQCGSRQYQEWDMALNKILCGLATTDLIPNGIELTEQEQTESLLLLKAVVDYWEALKGSSIEALQNTFLLREGKISFKDDHWLLNVERSGVDILLERLPWGIGTVKLPWLDELIYTEW
ncbi:hypothetical protein GS399_01735 [Pedobacter sp. HMF7647]|uniref:Uncharacterized protein n=1 Tax=Hufsiella arboris TaxID=2695275 RepID=A0A7K1Y513_9SPHI|nr:hypothetical protein [Hufsiella arboris]